MCRSFTFWHWASKINLSDSLSQFWLLCMQSFTKLLYIRGNCLPTQQHFNSAFFVCTSWAKGRKLFQRGGGHKLKEKLLKQARLYQDGNRLKIIIFVGDLWESQHMQIKMALKSQERMQRKKASKTLQETVLFLNCKPKCKRD